MRHAIVTAAILTGAILAVPAGADGVRIYPYDSTENYCPTGLQPVSIAGVICCGTPNQSMTYQQVMRHPVPKRQVRQSRPASICPEGVKGCY